MCVTIRIHFKLFRQIPGCGPLSNKFHHNARDIVGGESPHYVFISCTLGIIKSSQGQFTDRLLAVLNFVLVRLIVIDFIKVFNYWTPPVNRRGLFITQNKLKLLAFVIKSSWTRVQLMGNDLTVLYVVTSMTLFVWNSSTMYMTLGLHRGISVDFLQNVSHTIA